MIAICYTGDKRFNYGLTFQNHKKLFDKLSEIGTINQYFFTKDLIDRRLCPYDDNQDDGSAQGRYRRGQGGAIQVWDFIHAVNNVQENIVIRMRTDTWFHDSAIEVIFNELKSIIDGTTDIAFFGSDLINQNVGKEFEKRFIDTESAGKVQDFLIMANKENLNSQDSIFELMDGLSPGKRRSGNKVFRFCIKPKSQAFSIICKIYLIRNFYKTEPSELEIFKDYLKSYEGGNSNSELADAYKWLSEQTK